MTNELERRITTAIPTTDNNVRVIDGTYGQMSDGIWENSPVVENAWRGLNLECDGPTIIITVTPRSSLWSKSDTEILDYIANKVKQVIKTEIDDGYTNWQMEWKRDCNIKSDYLSGYLYNKNGPHGRKVDVTVADAYYVYDKLKGRK